ncbi:epoxide hydrolase family protein [Anaeromyxobacter terrae]|uniref:epoxide hydrolase family protein n=1 Tax=Anaeromyxobacter terrae TaxID=2925406 RepID=UPI001F5ADFBF|nr:epoxide hydrolase family protein [Anaeromyxobacter sp. SG22]
MSASPSMPGRRSSGARPVTASALGALLLAGVGCTRMVSAADGDASAAPGVGNPMSTGLEIRPFHVHVPDAALVDLRRRIAATRWPDRETVTDPSQGAQLAKLQGLVQYWGSGYDWRKAEAKLNALPQFTTNIDGIDVHFIHVRSRHKNALPVIITHGWPGSVLELIKVIGPLTDPTAHGGRAEDAFDVVIPSVPGYGFSGKPTGTGWDPDRIARAWAELMKRLGYNRYVAQGGDWGAPISSAMARQAPAGLLGIHLNLAATVPPEVEAALASGGAAPAGLSENERAVFDALAAYRKAGSSAYFVMMTARPQAVGYGLTDSPAGLAAWILVHPGFAQWTYGDAPGKSPTKDDVLDDITLYWLTNSASSSARLYWENRGRSVTGAAAQKTAEISLPVAITVFPEDVYRPPETWARRAYRNLIYFHEVDRGGHFAAWEQPELFAAELRAAFSPLRASATNVARP